MICHWRWITACVAGVCLGGIAVAQESGGAAASGSGGGAAGSAAEGSTPSGAGKSGAGKGGAKAGSKGQSNDPGSPESPEGTPETLPPGSTTPEGKPAPKTGGIVDPFIPTTPKPAPGESANGPGASSSFGTPTAPGEPTGTQPGEATGDGPTGPSSAFGPGDSTASQTAPPSFTLPGFFGGPATTYTGGQGRLARPRFRFKVTTSQGYDDNVLQTPDDPFRFPNNQILIDPGTPDTVTFEPVTTTTFEQAFTPDGELVFQRPVTTTTFRRVITPGRPPVFVPAPEPQERIGSLVSRVGVRFDTQQVTRRSLFTLDMNGSFDRYWNRTGQDGQDDYSGSISLAYLYNLTPRLQASFTSNVAYISQPDLTRINTPDRLGAGDIVNALARLNVQYRVTPRLTTTLSAGQNAILYLDQGSGSTAANNGDIYETTFSAEAKYLWKPRYTLIAEFRHVLINYPDSPSLNATSEVLLVGAEIRLSSRLSGTVRLGQAIRIFEDTGETSSAPYGEASINYRIGQTSSIQWNSRFGFEEPPSAGSETISFRSSVNYFKAFTPRLSLSSGITGLSRNTSFRGGDDQKVLTIDANIALEYHFTRQLTLNATFSFTKVISNVDNLDYDRSRVFIGAEYEF